jgi:hypothetical protein
MKKYSYLIIIVLISSLVLTGCLLSNVGQVPTTEQSGISYLTKSVPPPDDLIGLWHFDEGSGQTAGDATGVNHGRLGSTTDDDVNDPQWVSGKFGTALSFDGNDFVLVADNSSIAPSSVTVEAWVKRPGTPGTFKYIISKYYVLKAGGWSSYAFYTGSTGGLYFYIGDATSYRLSPDAGTGVWDGEWHHIAGTFDNASDTLKLYVDGVLVSGTPLGTGQAIGYDSGDLYFGTYRFPDGSWCFSGLIDEVRIWKVALLPNQLDFYGFNGLLAPYVSPYVASPKAFKIGSSIPLKWQYTDFAGTVVDSSAANPSVEIKKLVSDGTTPVEDVPIFVNDPGISGLRYDAFTMTWQFNWQTKELQPGIYNIRITSGLSGQTNGPFPIQLK